MLSRAADELPVGPGWCYEPKWDGFRAIARAGGGEVQLDSRTDRPLGRYFPELLELLDGLEQPFVLDGEIVIVLPPDSGYGTAAAMGTPTLALFGPSGEHEWGPWMVHSRVAVSRVHPCRPCGIDGCGGGKVSECLTTLRVDDVYAQFVELLAESASATESMHLAQSAPAAESIHLARSAPAADSLLPGQSRPAERGTPR